jgi:hypothetical protein
VYASTAALHRGSQTETVLVLKQAFLCGLSNKQFSSLYYKLKTTKT